MTRLVCPTCRRSTPIEDGASLRHGILAKYIMAMSLLALALDACIDLGADYFGLGMASALGLFFLFVPFFLEIVTIRKTSREQEVEDLEHEYYYGPLRK